MALQRRKELRSKKGLQRKKELSHGDSRLQSKAPLARNSKKKAPPDKALSGSLAPGAPLPKKGKRGRRLEAADRRQEKVSHDLPCVCGCNADPKNGEVSRAHLESRAIESTRNEDWNNPPACVWLNRWLDSESDGTNAETGAKVELRAMARELDRRLTQEDVEPVIRRHGYYEWRAKADCRGAISRRCTEDERLGEERGEKAAVGSPCRY